MPTPGLSGRWPSRLSKRSVRGRVSTPEVGTTSASALSLCVNAMPPRITEKSYRPRVSDRTMVDTRSAHPHLACSTFQKSTGVERICFPSLSIISERGPRRPGFASPRLAARPGPLRAVLKNAFPPRGKGGSRNQQPPTASRWSATTLLRKEKNSGDLVGIACRHHGPTPFARPSVTT